MLYLGRRRSSSLAPAERPEGLLSSPHMAEIVAVQAAEMLLPRVSFGRVGVSDTVSSSHQAASGPIAFCPVSDVGFARFHTGSRKRSIAAPLRRL